ncbi:hypothetical protein [Helicobacter bilis]|uniref:hypothetical protein n=1 Tax=Helicobacter bilis TaxID=37372 RepID=UPI002A8321B0|nr:hypothetical protein [Helicobacter bilis]
MVSLLAKHILSLIEFAIDLSERYNYYHKDSSMFECGGLQRLSHTRLHARKCSYILLL